MTIAAYLLYSVLLYIAWIAVQAVLSIAQYGAAPLVGARDTMAEPLPQVGRVRRANQNMLEALGMFTPVALLAIHLNVESATIGAAIFFWARFAFAPLYLLGVPWLRTLVWFVGVAGILMMILKLLPLI